MNKLVLALVALVAAALFAGTASAGNWSDGRLDTVASAVAGHPVQVWCESSWTSWVGIGDTLGEDMDLLEGFTFPGQSTEVFIAPDRCETLHALLDSGGPDEVGGYYASQAVHDLVHESEHQAGHVDEGETDCAALAIDDQIAVQYFGYRKTEIEYRWVQQKRKGKLVWVHQQRTVPNWLLADFHDWDHAWHKAAPPEYQGGCS